jgi:predicted O-methyltransferase YrrM
MRAKVIMITCPQRASMLEGTLARLANTDWAESPRIQMDPALAGDCCSRQTENFRLALEWFASQSDADFALVLEDDLDFNRHLRWNLERWSPVVEERLDFGSLYNPNVRNQLQGEDCFIADPSACYGSQAYLLSRAAVALILRDWLTVAGMQDIKTTRILARASIPLFYHQPSLVQHVGVQSVWGGGYHSTPDFSPDWKCSFSHDRIPGWFTFPKLYERAVAEAKDGDMLVEIGAWLGRSTAFLGHQVHGSGKRLRVLVVDTFRGSANEAHMVSCAQALGGSVRRLFDRNMRLAGVLETLEIREELSVQAARAVPDRSCFMVFIDADHTYEALRSDIRAWRDKVRPGGLLAGHDCYTYANVLAAVRAELGQRFVTTDENVWVHRVGS